MNNVQATNEEKFYYAYLWIFTIGLGLIGLLFARNYIEKVTANPQYSEVFSRDFLDWINHGQLLSIPLFYLYFKALGHGLNRHRYIGTFVKLTIWSTVVVLLKIIIVLIIFSDLRIQSTGALEAYMLAAITHLSHVSTFGIFIFPITTIYMIIKYIRYKLKERASKVLELPQ